MGTGRRTGAVAAGAFALGVAACGGSAAPPPAGSRIGPALLVALEAADHARAPWRCAAVDGPKLADETITIDKHAWKLAEHTMQREATGAVTIGVIADAGGAAAPTLAAIGRLRAKLEDADLVIALGGMGQTQAELEATLGALADRATWPLVALAGDLESQAALVDAIAALRTRGLVIIDGRLARRILIAGMTIGTLPGAGAPSRLVAGGDGCGYQPADVAALLHELTGRPGLRVLATAEPPRITIGGELAGELALTPTATQEIDVILHGPAVETASPARSGGRDGAAAPLSPGTADATMRLPGPRRSQSAGLLTVNGSAWRWRPIADGD
ncbi:MAG: hypothetical protein H0T89_05095 [Deltaproteobacteria bacterium]|nr:hypothetical protein [Deltaproteobacteria bacterium]MDQ3300385.1 hypothetical protein [Myxococcota bacterium]